MLRKLFGSLALFAISAWAAPPAQLAYDQDNVPPQNFNATGSWTVEDIAGSAAVTHLTKHQSRKLIGTTLKIDRETASLWNKKLMQWRYLPTPVINEETYKTASKEFWFDFETDPNQLQLPANVTIVDIELGDIVYAGPQRIFLLYEGVWYKLSRS